MVQPSWNIYVWYFHTVITKKVLTSEQVQGGHANHVNSVHTVHIKNSATAGTDYEFTLVKWDGFSFCSDKIKKVKKKKQIVYYAVECCYLKTARHFGHIRLSSSHQHNTIF